MQNRQPCEVWSRTNGYYRPINQWNDAKQEEFKDRKYFNFNKYDNQPSKEEIN